MPVGCKGDLPPLESIRVHEEYAQREPSQARRAITIVLTIAVLAAAGFGIYHYYPLLRQQSSAIAQLPAMQHSLAAVSGRMDSAEQKLRSWASDRDDLVQRMGKVESKMSGAFALARKQARELIAQAQQRMQAELDRRNAATDARLSRVEAAQESEQARLAQLQEQVASVRHEMTQQLAYARQESAHNLASLDQRVVDLNQRADHSRNQLDALNRQVDRQRVDFEVTRNHSREVTAEISLSITKIDTRYRRFDGWVQLVPEGRTLWIRGQSVQQPVTFYTRKDSRPNELVVTNLTRDSVAGYLLVPVETGGAGRSAAAGLLSSVPAGQ